MEVTTTPTQERAIFFRNLTTTTEQYTMQPTLPLGDIEENVTTKRNLAPTFKPYDNKQFR